MPSFNMYNGSNPYTQIGYTVVLSNPFTPTHYQKFVISTGTVTNGSTTAPSGIVQTIYSASGNSDTIYGEITNRSTNSIYTYRCYAQVPSGGYYFVGEDTHTTWSQTTTSTPPAPTLNYRTEGGFNVVWGSAEGASSYILKVVRGYDNHTVTYNSGSSRTYLVTGLQYGVSYSISVASVNPYGYSSNYSASNGVTTAPKTPTITGSATSNSITITVGSMSGNYTDFKVHRYNSSNVYIDTKTITSGNSVSWAGLTVGTQYKFNAQSRLYINSTWLESVGYASDIWITVNSFSWATPKVSGGDFNLTSQEWNDLLNQINIIRESKGLPKYTVYSYGTYTGTTAFTLPSQGNTFYAYQFNQARNAINEMSPSITVPTAVNSGDDVLASKLNGIVSSLNSIT